MLFMWCSKMAITSSDKSKFCGVGGGSSDDGKSLCMELNLFSSFCNCQLIFLWMKFLPSIRKVIFQPICLAFKLSSIKKYLVFYVSLTWLTYSMNFDFLTELCKESAVIKLPLNWSCRSSMPLLNRNIIVTTPVLHVPKFDIRDKIPDKGRSSS